jgi:high affinity Mn2+ porin
MEVNISGFRRVSAYARVHSRIDSGSRAIVAFAAVSFLSGPVLCNAQPVGPAPQPPGIPVTPEPAGQVAPETWAFPPYDWTGLYVGGHFGYGRGQMNNTLFGPAETSSGNSFGSLYGGFQAGYDYMFPSRILLGIEADVSFPNFLEDGVASTRSTAQSIVTDKIDALGTLRGRFGYAFDRGLIYGTGGFAWSSARFLESPGLVSGTDQVLRTRTGWAAGMGAEVALASDWTARVEYLYEHLGNATAIFPSGTRYQSALDIHTLRVGIDYRFGRPEADSLTPAGTDPWPLASENWNIHGQTTFIEQGYPAFHSPYQGTNSLTGASQAKNTISATAFIGFRLWDGTEVYVDPELMQGFGLSNTFGVAGFPNGEAQKSNFPIPRVNVARAYVRQIFGLGGEQETIEDGPNQIAGKQDVSRVTITAGKFMVTDFFDTNGYANDPRTDFLNWNMYGGGSYDLTMDKLSYTWGAFAELNQKYWAVRAGYFLVPTISNVNTLDLHIPSRGEYATELELRYSLFSQPGKLRLFGWANRATAGSYSEAVALPVTSPNYPDITATRTVRTNYGFIVNVEQAITGDLGVFSRVTWDAGQTEKIGWTDCDESLSLGVVLKGTAWGRPNDNAGAGGVVEALSPAARAYFAAGGLGILIGDGKLNYQYEKILEAFYAYSVNKWVTVSFDYQFVADPGYNADRGPVSIFSVRLHAEF